MKNAIKHEMKKLLSSKDFGVAIMMGIFLVIAHFISVACYVDRIYFKNVAVESHPMGLDNISLLALFLPADNWFMTAFLFYLVLPILAALPFGTSLYKERRIGYQLQIIVRIGKKHYLTAKLLVCAISGFITVSTLLIIDTMLCATVCPLVTINVLSLVSGVMQGSFASSLFYNFPVLYIVVCILMTSIWGTVCAVLALASEMYLQNSFLISTFPCLMMLILTSLMEYLRGTLFDTTFEIRPLFLMRAAPANFNPAWYILLWQCGFIVPAVIAYYWKGMKRENL